MYKYIKKYVFLYICYTLIKCSPKNYYNSKVNELINVIKILDWRLKKDMGSVIH